MTDSGRRARLLAASLPLTLLAAACAPPGVGEAVPLTDAVTPTGGTCLGCDRPSGAASSPHRVHYDADLLLDVDAGTLRATWRMDYTFSKTPPEHFAFLLNRGLRIDRLEGTGIRGHRIEQFHVPHWNLVVLQLEGDPAPGESITLHVSYSGRLDLPHPVNRISADWVELNIESMWHPIFATTDREMWGELRVVLPPGWEVIGASKPSQRDGRHVLRNLSPQTDVAFVAARDFESRASPRFTLHHVGADNTRVAAVLESAEACAAYLDPLYGARTPLPHGQLVLADRGGVSYARGTFLVFSEIEDPEDRLWLEPAICHELAHHWTAYGNFLGPDHWMTEAFPEYISARYARTRFGRKAFEAMVARWREGAEGTGPVWTPEASTRPAGGAMYRLAPYLLYRLEERIGKDRFDRLAEAYMVEDIRSTSELLEQLRKIAGPEAERTFREELASHGPDVLPDDPEARTVSFTADESTFLAFDISPDGRWIVFTLLGQLWRIPAEGGEAVQMTDAVRDTAVDASPSISADGRSSIVFTAHRPGGAGLFLLTPDDGAVRKLTWLEDNQSFHSPAAWDPAGRRLAFVRNGRIQLLDAASAQEHAIAIALPAETPFRPDGVAWSPDGRRIAFSSAGTVWQVDASGGQATSLNVDGSQPAFSPDGGRLAFVAPDSSGMPRVWVRGVDGGEPVRLTDHGRTGATSPRWSPDGRAVLFAADGRLWRVPVAGGAPTAIPFTARISFERQEITTRAVSFAAPETSHAARGHMGLALSPDGELIAMVALSRLWIFAPGEEARAATTVPVTAMGLTWSPDGREVAWSAGRGGEEDLFATDVRTGETRRLTRLEGMAIKPSWSPDGSRIAFIHWTIPDPAEPVGSPVRRLAQLRHIPTTGPVVERIEDSEHLGDVAVQWTFRGSNYTQETPQWSPDGSVLLLRNQRFSAIGPAGDPVTFEALPGWMPFLQWRADGSLVFVHNGRLVAVDFDPDSGGAGPALPLSDDPAMFVTASRAGDLLYLSGDGLRLRGPDGQVQALGWPLSFRAPAAPSPLLIRGARVVPGDGSPPLPPQDVLVRDGRIVSITPTGALPPPQDAGVVDGVGRWLIPGLIEMHLHSWMDSALPALLYAGVTTARDLGAPMARVAGFRDAGEAGVVASSRLVFGSLQFSRPFDGYSGDSYSGPSDDGGFHRAMSIMRALGATQLKFRPEGTHTREMARLVEYARREGWPVSGHYATLPLVAAGVSGKEHAWVVHSDVVQLYASAGVWVVPAMAGSNQHLRVMDDPELIEGPLAAALVDPFLRYLLRSDADPRWREDRERMAESGHRSVATLHSAGVTVLAGTDAPGQPWALHWELEDLVASGLSPLEALTAATGAAARALGAQDEVGTVEVGKWADLVLLDADPLEDIRNTQRIRKVIQGGRVVDREALLNWAREAQQSGERQ
jgi:Tol biopolymer transport system component/imidazolonepropionase-like amidohydrolase